MTVRRWAALALAAVVLTGAAACGGGSDDGRAAGEQASSSKGAGSDGPDDGGPAGGASKDGAGKGDGNGNVGATSGTVDPKPSGTPSPQDPAYASQGQPGGNADDPSITAADYLQARYEAIGFGESTPRGCTLKPGEHCRMRFDGFYRMGTVLNGKISVAAYEDDKAEPASSTALPVAKGASRWFIDRFLYPVSAEAKKVTFKVTLVDGDGKVLYEGLSKTAEITR